LVRDSSAFPLLSFVANILTTAKPDLVNVCEVFLPQLLMYPNPTDPLNGEAAALLMRDPENYVRKVKEYVSKYASEQAANDAGSESESEMSSLESFSDDDDAPGMEL